MASGDLPVATRVMTRCPVDDRDVFTGHRMRPAEMQALREPRSFRCSCCARVHSWTAASAWCETRPRFN